MTDRSSQGYGTESFLVRTMPMLPLVGIAIGGILTGKWYGGIWETSLWELFDIILAFFFVVIIVLKRKFEWIYLKSMLLRLLIFMYFFLATMQALSVDLSGVQGDIHTGIVCEPVTVKGRSTRLGVMLHEENPKNDLKLHGLKVKLYTSPNSGLEHTIKLGDWVVFKGSLRRIRNQGNPFEFDYQGYMQKKGFYYQAFIPDTLIIDHGIRGGMPLKRLASNLQYKVIALIRHENFNKHAEALLIALLAGDKAYVDDEMQASFQNSGAIHVLAVSGLHVGVVYIMLNFLLGFLNKNKYLSLLKSVLIILLIWLYALVTGLSPSVQRAALMFTLMSLGKLMNRDTSIYNILSGAAFILLAGNPLLLYDVGFQLSFIAVGGIVFFQPLIYNWLYIPYRWLDYFYKLFSVSLAAQITTVPLTLYYFHQFPTYFWLTNMLIMFPLFVLIFASAAFILTSGFAALKMIFSKVIGFLATFINHCVDAVGDLPFAVIHNISIKPVTVLLLYAFIVAITLWLLNRKGIYLIWSVLLVLTMQAISWGGVAGTNSQCIVYNVGKNTAVGLHSGAKNLLLLNPKDGSRGKDYCLKVARAHWMGAKLTNDVDISYLDSLYLEKQPGNIPIIRLNGATIMFYNRFCTFDNYAFPDHSDVLIVSQSVYPPKEKVNTKLIVLDSSNNLKSIHRWKDFATKYGVEIKSVKEEGAAIIDLDYRFPNLNSF